MAYIRDDKGLMGVKAKMPQALQPCPLAHLLSRASSALWSVCFANTTACKLDLRQSSPEINKHKSKHDYYPTIEKMTGNKQTERTVRTMLTPSASRKARSSPLATAASSFRRASTSNARSEMNITQNNLVGISIGEITEYGFNLLTSDARNMMKHAHDLTCEVGAASEKKKVRGGRTKSAGSFAPQGSGCLVFVQKPLRQLDLQLLCVSNRLNPQLTQVT